jgi:hypothetical protein
MQQAVCFHFGITKNERVYQIIVQPGSPWEDIQEVINEFKSEFTSLEQQALKAEQEKNKDKENIDTPVSE